MRDVVRDDDDELVSPKRAIHLVIVAPAQRVHQQDVRREPGRDNGLLQRERIGRIGRIHVLLERSNTRNFFCQYGQRRDGGQENRAYGYPGCGPALDTHRLFPAHKRTSGNRGAAPKGARYGRYQNTRVCSALSGITGIHHTCGGIEIRPLPTAVTRC